MVGTGKRKLAARHGGGINQPTCRALEGVARKCTKKGGHKKRWDNSFKSNDL